MQSFKTLCMRSTLPIESLICVCDYHKLTSFRMRTGFSSYSTTVFELLEHKVCLWHHADFFFYYKHVEACQLRSRQVSLSLTRLSWLSSLPLLCCTIERFVNPWPWGAPKGRTQHYINNKPCHIRSLCANKLNNKKNKWSEDKTLLQ